MTPPTRVVHRSSKLSEAARAIGFPLLVKANIGGAGAGITRYDSTAELDAAIAAGRVPQSVDQVLLVQTYVEPRGQRICRMETLGGKFLYAIDIAVDGNFDLCPANACQVPGRSVAMAMADPPADMAAATEATVRPNFHQPALFAKQAANIDNISNGRLALNVVSSWWADEATQHGLTFDAHDDRYARTSEWLTVVDGLWTQPRFSHEGARYQLKDAICEPKPIASPRPMIYAGGESDAAKAMIAEQCDAYVMHGGSVEAIGAKIADMKERRDANGQGPMQFGMAAYAIVRDSEEEARAEQARITAMPATPPKGFDTFEQWLSGTQLEREIKLRDYSVSNRGLMPDLVGTPGQVRQKIEAYEAAGLDLLLLQMSPQAEEMDRFAEAVIAAMKAGAAT